MANLGLLLNMEISDSLSLLYLGARVRDEGSILKNKSNCITVKVKLFREADQIDFPLGYLERMKGWENKYKFLYSYRKIPGEVYKIGGEKYRNYILEEELHTNYHGDALFQIASQAAENKRQERFEQFLKADDFYRRVKGHPVIQRMVDNIFTWLKNYFYNKEYECEFQEFILTTTKTKVEVDCRYSDLQSSYQHFTSFVNYESMGMQCLELGQIPGMKMALSEIFYHTLQKTFPEYAAVTFDCFTRKNDKKNITTESALEMIQNKENMEFCAEHFVLVKKVGKTLNSW